MDDDEDLGTFYTPSGDELKWIPLFNEYRSTKDITEAKNHDPSPEEIKKWEKFIFLEKKTNQIRLTDEANKRGLLINGLLDSIEAKKIITALVKRQKEKGDDTPTLIYEPINVSPKLYMPYSIPIHLDKADWLPYQNEFHNKEHLFRDKQASYWTDYVSFDRENRKVQLHPIGESLLLAKKTISPLEVKIFREIIASLLMKKSGPLNFGSVSRMESVELPPPFTSVRALSVELLPPSLHEPATIQFLPLFKMKKLKNEK
ncbi:MAG: hypothetical protein Hyperionvirus26_3 [Hyperionvirus sp.]|uniref:Uncharacterized protein n=1 Tax=Hyperionvirus sp. TaxID=2487770 RepID=A0A3G5AB31_9VIRU|nr:MAG: hypothetical protein Hyperionvirus26_3 [Hyperionvirus sp.]